MIPLCKKKKIGTKLGGVKEMRKKKRGGEVMKK